MAMPEAELASAAAAVPVTEVAEAQSFRPLGLHAGEWQPPGTYRGSGPPLAPGEGFRPLSWNRGSDRDLSATWTELPFAPLDETEGFSPLMHHRGEDAVAQVDLADSLFAVQGAGMALQPLTALRQPADYLEDRSLAELQLPKDTLGEGTAPVPASLEPQSPECPCLSDGTGPMLPLTKRRATDPATFAAGLPGYGLPASNVALAVTPLTALRGPPARWLLGTAELATVRELQATAYPGAAVAPLTARRAAEAPAFAPTLPSPLLPSSHLSANCPLTAQRATTATSAAAPVLQQLPKGAVVLLVVPNGFERPAAMALAPMGPDDSNGLLHRTLHCLQAGGAQSVVMLEA